MQNRLRHLAKRLLKPPFINYIDVGAAGKLQDPWKRHQGKIHHWLRFEPNEDNVQQDKTRLSMDVALWHTKETRPFYVIGEHGYGSSLLKPDLEYVRDNYDTLKQLGDPDMATSWAERSKIIKTETVTTQTLDDVLAEVNQQNVYHFLKTDAQGADYYIFKGAEKLLSSSCVAIQSEQFVYPLYKDTVLLEETSAYLAQFGFELVKKFPPHGSFYSQHDCLFIKKGIENKVVNTIRAIYGVD